jgi:hypothetical protein
MASKMDGMIFINDAPFEGFKGLSNKNSPQGIFRILNPA